MRSYEAAVGATTRWVDGKLTKLPSRSCPRPGRSRPDTPRNPRCLARQRTSLVHTPCTQSSRKSSGTSPPHTSRTSSGQKTARQKELAERLSDKVQNRLARLDAQQKEAPDARTNASAKAGETLGAPTANLRFAKARAKKRAELEELERLGAAPGPAAEGTRRPMRDDSRLPTATALPAPGPAGECEAYTLL